MIENLTTNLETAIQSAPLVAIAISLAAGIATSFTPCVYPLVPIPIGFIGAKGSTTKLRGFYLSLMYVLGLAIVYSALGAFAALTGMLSESGLRKRIEERWPRFVETNIKALELGMKAGENAKAGQQ